MRFIVCGGRSYADTASVFRALDLLNSSRGVTVLIQGGATGADAVAAEWADKNRIETVTFKADWKTYGRSAGPMRNRRMIAEGRPDGVVAFPGGNGTKDMIKAAIEAGLKVWQPGGHFAA